MRAGKASVCQTNLKDSSRLNPPKVRWCQKIKHEGKQVSTKLSESGVQSHVITLFLCFHGEKGHCTCDLTNLRIPNATNNKGMLLNEGFQFHVGIKWGLIFQCSCLGRTEKPEVFPIFCKDKNSVIGREIELCCVRWEAALRPGYKSQTVSSFPSTMLCICVSDLMIWHVLQRQKNEVTVFQKSRRFSLTSTSSGHKNLFCGDFSLITV